MSPIEVYPALARFALSDFSQRHLALFAVYPDLSPTVNIAWCNPTPLMVRVTLYLLLGLCYYRSADLGLFHSGGKGSVA